jgi:hypothetical protein
MKNNVLFFIHASSKFFFENNAKKSFIFSGERERQMKRVKETFSYKLIISLILILWVPIPPLFDYVFFPSQR